MLQEMSVASSPPLDLDQDSLELFTEEKEGHVAEFTKVQWLIAFISVLTVEDPDPNPLPVLWIQILWIWIRILTFDPIWIWIQGYDINFEEKMLK